MALTEETIVDRIEARDDGQVQIRMANLIKRDGTVISRELHRYVLNPGADVSGEPPTVQAVCAALWTVEVIDAWNARVAAEKAAAEAEAAARAGSESAL